MCGRQVVCTPIARLNLNTVTRIHIIRPRRLNTVHEMRHIVTYAARSVVYLCVGHSGELCKECKNGRTDRDAVWIADSCESKVPSDPVLDRGPHLQITRAGPFARGGPMQLPSRGVTRQRCGLLPNYFGHCFIGCRRTDGRT